jgi:hypothetical protein
MTDRELLEAAAKAFWADDEVSTRFDEREDGLLYIHADNQDHNGSDREFVWNPLHDDGDALRLAVRLNIDVFQSTQYREAQAGGQIPKTIFEPWGADKGAATRRAIVRAAAEIGRAIP